MSKVRGDPLRVALAHPTREALVSALNGAAEMSTVQLQESTGVTRYHLYHHLQQLEKAGVELTKSGSIKINDDYQTSEGNIYAIGDVTDRINLTPVAIAQGHVLADNLFGPQTGREVDYENIPTAVFSHPPIGTVGMTECQAKEKGIDFDIYNTEFTPLIHQLSCRAEKTFMKLIVEKKTDKVIGLHILGRDAPEMLQGFAVAIKAGATKADFDATIGIHPTAAEEIVTMRAPCRTLE